MDSAQVYQSEGRGFKSCSMHAVKKTHIALAKQFGDFIVNKTNELECFSLRIWDAKQDVYKKFAP